MNTLRKFLEEEAGATAVEYGLLAASEVDNAEPAHAQTEGWADEEALSVRPAVRHLPHHSSYVFLCLLAAANYSADSTHNGYGLRQTRLR